MSDEICECCGDPTDNDPLAFCDDCRRALDNPADSLKADNARLAARVKVLEEVLRRVTRCLSQSRPDRGSPSDDLRAMWHESNEALIEARAALAAKEGGE